MGNTSPAASDDRAVGHSREWIRKEIVVPVAVAVLGALLVGALTPVGDGLRELFFPTKAIVTGTVLVGGQPAPRADLMLDGIRVGETSERGGFLFEGVANGVHRLGVETVDTHPPIPFIVERGTTKLDLGLVELSPLLQLSFYGGEAFAGPGQVRYDLILWLEGDPETMSRIQSVSYGLPPPLLTAQVTSRAVRKSFCFRKMGELPFQDIGILFGATATATVNFSDGQPFQLSAQRQFTPPSFGCSVRGEEGTPPPPLSPSPSPPPSPPSPSSSASPSPSQTLFVPDVVCRTYASAKAELEALGVGVLLGDPLPPNPVCPNPVNVVEQDTEPGSPITPGMVIVLHQGAALSPSPSESG